MIAGHRITIKLVRVNCWRKIALCLLHLMSRLIKRRTVDDGIQSRLEVNRFEDCVKIH